MSKLVAGVPRGHGGLVESTATRRFVRASKHRGVRFYTIARGSVLECAAVLDALEAMAVFGQNDLSQARELLERIVSMLTGLIRP